MAAVSIVPGDLDLRPRREPIVLEKEIQFKVDGRVWTAARVELIQDNGEKIETEPFVLMDHTWIDQFVRDASFQLDHNPAPDLFKECVNKAVRMLEEALATPG